MPAREMKVNGEVAVGGGIYPVQAKLGGSYTHGFNSRAEEVIQPIIKVIGTEELIKALENSEELEVLVTRAVTSGANTAHTEKRKLLAKIVQDVVLDDSKIDHSILILQLIEQLEGPHIRCLEDIHRAEEWAKESGEMGEVAPSAEKPITNEVLETARKYPDILLRSLQGLDLIDAQVTWDGNALVTGLTSAGSLVLQELRSVAL